MEHKPYAGFEALMRGEAHPHDATAAATVRHLETHISHILFTSSRPSGSTSLARQSTGAFSTSGSGRSGTHDRTRTEGIL